MQTKVSGALVQQKALYKRYLDKKLNSLPVFTVGLANYGNRPPLTRDRQTSVKCNKLLPRTKGSLIIFDERNQFLAMDKNGIASTISIDGATPIGSQHCQHLPKGTKPRHHTTKLHAKRQNQFFVHKIVAQRERVDGIQHRIRWYRYRTRDDTFKSPFNILQHFISRYWNR